MRESEKNCNYFYVFVEMTTTKNHANRICLLCWLNLMGNGFVYHENKSINDEEFQLFRNLLWSIKPIDSKTIYINLVSLQLEGFFFISYQHITKPTILSHLMIALKLIEKQNDKATKNKSEKRIFFFRKCLGKRLFAQFTRTHTHTIFVLSEK